MLIFSSFSSEEENEENEDEKEENEEEKEEKEKTLENVTTDYLFVVLYYHRSKRTFSLPTLTLDNHHSSPVSTLILIIVPVSGPKNGPTFCQQGSTARPTVFRAACVSEVGSSCML